MHEAFPSGAFGLRFVLASLPLLLACPMFRGQRLWDLLFGIGHLLTGTSRRQFRLRVQAETITPASAVFNVGVRDACTQPCFDESYPALEKSSFAMVMAVIALGQPE
jgi:hypothetical protein